MQTFIVRCPSITYAQKGQKVLEQHGLRSRLTRIGVQGCAFGLEITAPDRSHALRLLEEAGVTFLL